jgi:hypothetical protein
MTDLLWPTTLPQAVDQSGYGEQPPDITVRTPMDSGPPKVRITDDGNSRLIQVSLSPVTADQVETFDEFFYDTLAGGALEFDWVHPRTGNAATCMILGNDQRPRYTPIGGLLWSISFTLEILP